MIKNLVLFVTLFSFQFLALGCSRKEAKNPPPASTTTESPSPERPDTTISRSSAQPSAISKDNKELIGSDVQKNIANVAAETQIENKKVGINVQIERLKSKKDNIKTDMNSDYVILKARFAELNYITDFLNINDDAQKLVAESLKSVKQNNPTLDLAAVSGIVFAPSFTLYALSKYGLPAVNPSLSAVPPLNGIDSATTSASKTQEFMLKAKATASRLYNSVRDNIKNERLHNVTGIMALSSAVVGGLALTANYIMSKPFNDSIENQTRIYLSLLATSNRTNYLSYSEIERQFTDRLNDKSFGIDVTSELNNILIDTKNKTDDIHVKEAAMLGLDQQKAMLEQQLREYNSQIKQLRKN